MASTISNSTYEALGNDQYGTITAAIGVGFEVSYILSETGFFILSEEGDKILLEEC